MENTYIVGNKEIEHFNGRQESGFRIEHLSDDLNLLHVRKDIVDCTQMLLERMLYLDSMGMRMSVQEMENLIVDFYGYGEDE